MVNVKPATYTVQIGPTMTPEAAGELAAWAELRRMSVSEIARECVEAGMGKLRGKWAKEVGFEMPASTLARHVEAARERGERQVRSRRAYDDRTRGKGGADNAA